MNVCVCKRTKWRQTTLPLTNCCKFLSSAVWAAKALWSLPPTWTPESCPDISAGTTAAGESLRHLWEGSVEFLGRVSGESPRLTRNLCGVSAASLRSPFLRAPEGLQHTFRHILSETLNDNLAIPCDIVFMFYIL